MSLKTSQRFKKMQDKTTKISLSTCFFLTFILEIPAVTKGGGEVLVTMPTRQHTCGRKFKSTSSWNLQNSSEL